MNISVPMAWYKSKGIQANDLVFYVVQAAFFSIPLGTSPPTLCGVIAALIWLLSGEAIRSCRDLARKTWFLPVLFFIALPWIGLLYTPDPAGLGIKFAQKTHYWIYCIVVASISFRIHSSERLIQAFLLGLAVNVLAAILQLAGLVPATRFYDSYYYYGFGLGYSTLSIYLILGILISSYYFREAKKRKTQILLLILITGYLFHLIILEGRVGFFTFVLVSPLIVRNLFPGFAPFKILLVCVLIFGMMCLSPTVRKRISKTKSELVYHWNADASSAWGKEYSEHQDRFYMWYGAVHIFLDNPLFGVGTGGYQTVMKERGKPEWPAISHPHNSFLYMAVSFGVIGLIVLLWFFAEMIKNGWRKRQTPLGFFVLSTALVIFISGFVDTQILDAGTLMLLALVTGLQQGFSSVTFKDE